MILNYHIYAVVIDVDFENKKHSIAKGVLQ